MEDDDLANLRVALFTSLAAAVASVAAVVALVPSLATFLPLIPLALSGAGLWHAVRARTARDCHAARRAAELSFHFGVFSACIAGLFVVLGVMGLVMFLRW